MKTREELVQVFEQACMAEDAARTEYNISAKAICDSWKVAISAVDAAMAALIAYDKENSK